MAEAHALQWFINELHYGARSEPATTIAWTLILKLTSIELAERFLIHSSLLFLLLSSSISCLGVFDDGFVKQRVVVTTWNLSKPFGLYNTN